MNIIVVGGGKVGYYLSKTLIEYGHNPTLIEMNKKMSAFIANDLDIPIINGDGTSIEIQDKANAKQSDILISVTGKDEDNLIACQLAKKVFNVKKTIAKVNNPKNSKIMKHLGIDIVISSTESIAQLLVREVDTTVIKQIVSLNGGEASLNEITIPENSRINNKKLSDIKLPEQSIIVSINRNNKMIIPRGNTEIKSGDIILVMSNNSSLQKVTDVLKIKKSDIQK